MKLDINERDFGDGTLWNILKKIIRTGDSLGGVPQNWTMVNKN